MIPFPDSEVQIEWSPNPLQTTVHLTEFGIEVLRLQLTIEQLEDLLFEHSYHATAPSREFDEQVTNRVAQILPHLVEALTDEAHVGDCTCVACSYSKCYAESLLGMHTLGGLGKHEAAAIGSQFRESDDIDVVIQCLVDYVPSATWEGWEPHADRWKAEATRAAAWMQTYKKLHGF